MSRGWKGTLLKFGGEVGEGRVHTEDTFSVPLGSFQPGWPTSPTLWPSSLSERVPSVCALTGPHWPPLSLWVFLHRSCREACGGALLNMIPPLLLYVTQDGVELSDPPGPGQRADALECKILLICIRKTQFVHKRLRAVRRGKVYALNSTVKMCIR